MNVLKLSLEVFRGSLSEKSRAVLGSLLDERTGDGRGRTTDGILLTTGQSPNPWRETAE